MIFVSVAGYAVASYLRPAKRSSTNEPTSSLGLRAAMSSWPTSSWAGASGAARWWSAADAYPCRRTVHSAEGIGLAGTRSWRWATLQGPFALCHYYRCPRLRDPSRGPAPAVWAAICCMPPVNTSDRRDPTTGSSTGRVTIERFEVSLSPHELSWIVGLETQFRRAERFEKELRRRRRIVDERQRSTGLGPGDVSEPPLLLQGLVPVPGIAQRTSRWEAAGVQSDDGHVVGTRALVNGPWRASAGASSGAVGDQLPLAAPKLPAKLGDGPVRCRPCHDRRIATRPSPRASGSSRSRASATGEVSPAAERVRRSSGAGPGRHRARAASRGRSWSNEASESEDRPGRRRVDCVRCRENRIDPAVLPSVGSYPVTRARKGDTISSATTSCLFPTAVLRFCFRSVREEMTARRRYLPHALPAGTRRHSADSSRGDDLSGALSVQTSSFEGAAVRTNPTAPALVPVAPGPARCGPGLFLPGWMVPWVSPATWPTPEPARCALRKRRTLACHDSGEAWRRGRDACISATVNVNRHARQSTRCSRTGTIPRANACRRRPIPSGKIFQATR